MLTKRSSLLALLLLVPAPTIGVLFGMYWFPNTALGATMFFISKLWLLAFPLAWHVAVNRARPEWPRLRRPGLATGLGTGLAIFAVIWIAFLTLRGFMVNREVALEAMWEIGLDRPLLFAGLAAWWSFVNSLLEEYVWRWFVVRQAMAIAGKAGAVIISAAAFTIHHIVAMNLYFPVSTTALAGAGIFVAGITWSWLYARYDSIWPGYISHVLADLAVFTTGWVLIFS